MAQDPDREAAETDPRTTADEFPDFEQIINATVATFAVFTGFVLTKSLEEIDIANWSTWRCWGYLAFVTLLLRYIFGSAIHLNATYVGESGMVRRQFRTWAITRGPPPSRHLILLFKDLLFLIGFGMIAVYIYQEKTSATEFARRTMLFLGAGLAWSIIDYLIRRFWSAFRERHPEDRVAMRIFDGVATVVFVPIAVWAFWAPDMVAFLARLEVFVAVAAVFAFVHRRAWPAPDARPARSSEWPGPFWRNWVLLDAVQFVVTSVLLVYLKPDLALAIALAITFILFLGLDMGFMVGAVRRGHK